jgi:hypothetical protein
MTIKGLSSGDGRMQLEERDATEEITQLLKEIA